MRFFQSSRSNWVKVLVWEQDHLDGCLKRVVLGTRQPSQDQSRCNSKELAERIMLRQSTDGIGGVERALWRKHLLSGGIIELIFSRPLETFLDASVFPQRVNRTANFGW